MPQPSNPDPDLKQTRTGNMNKEIELATVNQWIAAPSSQNSENLASKSHETRRIPDPYVFLVRGGKILTLLGEKVEKSVTRGGFVNEAEYEALIKIQDWASLKEGGTSLWFSPPFEGGYSCLKIVASEILYAVSGEKVILNRAIVLDVGRDKTLEIANSFEKEIFNDPEELRAQPIFLGESENWVDKLSFYTDQTEQIKLSTDLEIKKETLKQVNIIYSTFTYQNTSARVPYYAEIEARKLGLIGDKEDSCSVGSNSAFNTLFNGRFSFEGPLGSFPCPRCNGPIPSGLGITTCPHCGLTKEQAGSTCG